MNESKTKLIYTFLIIILICFVCLLIYFIFIKANLEENSISLNNEPNLGDKPNKLEFSTTTNKLDESSELNLDKIIQENETKDYRVNNLIFVKPKNYEGYLGIFKNLNDINIIPSGLMLFYYEIDCLRPDKDSFFRVNCKKLVPGVLYIDVEDITFEKTRFIHNVKTKYKIDNTIVKISYAFFELTEDVFRADGSGVIIEKFNWPDMSFRMITSEQLDIRQNDFEFNLYFTNAKQVNMNLSSCKGDIGYTKEKVRDLKHLSFKIAFAVYS